jgi:acetylornithine deacetylase/succinyl-diaminopimelate desuccinylase-like protein
MKKRIFSAHPLPDGRGSVTEPRASASGQGRMLLMLCLLSSPLFAAEPDWPNVEKHALDLLQKYVRIASVNPPANTTEAAALIKGELEAAGFTPKLYVSGPQGQTNLIVRLPGRDRSKKPLLLLNHFDVVPVDAGAWGAIDPFGALIKDGQIWGRGSLDMKGLAVEQMTALIELKRLGLVPPRDIVMLSTADEEAGGVLGIQWMLKNHFDEIDPAYVLDEGGAGSRDLFAQGKLIFGVAVGEKQMLWLRLRAKGTAGHGSQPIADNANLILLDAIHKGMEATNTAKQNPVVESMLKAAGGGFAPNKFTGAIQGNTISLTTLQSGVGSPVKPNVIPSVAEATLDCRLLPGVNADEFESGIKARINDRRVTVERLTNPVDAGMSSAETPLFAAIRAALLKAHPDAVVTPMLVPYGTDSVQLRKRGIPAYGFMPMVVDAATVATMHSDQERVPVAEFLRGIRIYFDVLRSEY